MAADELQGSLKYEETEQDAGEMPTVNMEVMVNVGNPESVFMFGQLPNGGIGLASLEFAINNAIGVQPKALLNYGSLDADIRAKIDERMKGTPSRRTSAPTRSPKAAPPWPRVCVPEEDHRAPVGRQVQRVQVPPGR